jgi:TolA-binding protein
MADTIDKIEKAAAQNAQPAPEAKEVKTAKQQQIEDMELEIKKLELEEKQLTIKSQKATLVDMEERLAERELKREARRQDAQSKGAALTVKAKNEATQQSNCNHKKGGNGAQGVVGGQGDDSQYAVLKHTFANGDTWVRCLRCGKTWKPPVKSDFKNNAEGYTSAMDVYKLALQFQTRNIPSKGIVFSYGEGGVELYRENTKNANLR